MDIKKTIGIKIKQLRQAKGWSQGELAARSDFDRTYIAHVERGCKNISMDSLAKLLEAFDMSFFDFFGSNEFAAASVAPIQTTAATPKFQRPAAVYSNKSFHHETL